MATRIHFPFHNLSDTQFNLLWNQDNSQGPIIPIATLNAMTYDPNYPDTDNADLNCLPKCEYVYPDALPHFYTSPSSAHFNIFCHNINSIKFHLSELEHFNIIPQQFDMLGFCESKLSADIQNQFCIQGYSQFTKNTTRLSGGIAIYLRETLKASIRHDISFTETFLESLFVEIKSNTEDLIVGVVYRRPKTNIVHFITQLENILEVVSKERKTCIITGDFNLDLFKAHSCGYVQDLITTFQARNFTNIITKATRVKARSATLIDHIWSNNVLLACSSSVIYAQISDHFPIAASFKTQLQSTADTVSKIFFRQYSEEKINQFKDAMNDVCWDIVTASTNPNVILDNFNSIFTPSFNKYFPLKEKILKKKGGEKPYITNEIRALITEKNKMRRKYSKHPITYGDQFRRLRNRVTQMIRTAETNYYKNSLIENQGNNKKTWQTIKTILNKPRAKILPSEIKTNNGYLTNNFDIANEFNNYFANVGANLASGISPSVSNYQSFLGNRVDDDLTLVPITQSELLLIIKNLRNEIGRAHV